MRTAYFVLIGLVIAGVCFALAKLFSMETTNAFKAFLGIWFVVSAFNLWLGVSRAGYPLSVELPVFAVVFVVPVALAYAAKLWWPI